jgi:N-acetyl-1-D-myo-inositol-2-amino-2-deoxy-alpha-D-glucopyranoside deacetylase
VSSIWRPIRERNPARSLMVIVAHPGDEAFGFAGAIASAAAEGAYVVVVCATRGYFDPRITTKPPAPGGRNRDLLDSLGWRNLDTVREDEMRRSAALLGVRILRMLDYAEGDLASVDFHHLVGRLVEPIRMHQPEVVLTYGPDGVTGDSDHVTLSRAVGEAVDKAALPLAYEDNLEEDQVAWRIAKLFHLVVPPEALAILGDMAPRAGYHTSSAGPTVALALGELGSLKLAAIQRHVSQTGSDGPFAGWDPAVRDNWLSAEHYRLAVSNLAGATPPAGVGSGLFDGVA